MKTVELKFEGIDDWNRPCFVKVDNPNWYCGDVENLFSYHTTSEEIKEFYEGKNLNKELIYLGEYFGCEPQGYKLAKDVNFVIV